MQRKKGILLPAVLALSLCSAPVLPVFAENAVQAETQDAAAAAAQSNNVVDGSAASNDNTAVAGSTVAEGNTEPVGTAADASDAGSSTASDEVPYTQGISTETDYQSEWLNLKFTPPETVVMNTQEELDSVMQQGQTTLEESSGMELGEDALAGTVYEMMASSINGFPNVSLVVETASLENMTVDQYFLAAQQMMDATGLGYTYEEITDAQIAGQDFRVMAAHVMVNDYEVIQKYCTRKQGGKFVSIILSYTTDTTEEADEMLAAFTPLNADTEAAPAE